MLGCRVAFFFVYRANCVNDLATPLIYLPCVFFQMMKHAWSSYWLHAKGHNELKPISKEAHDAAVLGFKPMGATIVDSIDTLFIMGMKEEYLQAADWIIKESDFNKVSISWISAIFFLLSFCRLLDSETFDRYTSDTFMNSKL